MSINGRPVAPIFLDSRMPSNDGWQVNRTTRYAAADMVTRICVHPFRNAPTATLCKSSKRPARSQARTWRRAHSFLLSTVVQSLVLLVVCACTHGAGTRSVTLLGPGIINDPKNKSLRFDILKFGLKNFCEEMLARGVALKLSDDHPVAGRFFGRECSSDVIDDDTRRSFAVRFSGLGYVWTNLTGRVGVDVLGAVELLPDFQMAPDGSMYVYFRTNRVDVTQMKILLVESSMARRAAAMTSADPERIGREILQAQLGRGFTVIRLNDTGQTEFGVGLLALGQHPYQPFKVTSDDPVLINERTEVHRGQQDFIGAFKVEGDDKALRLAVTVDGAPAVNVAVISGAAGKQLIDRYVHTAGVAPLLEPPRFSRDVSFGSLWQQVIPVSEGTYYVLLQQPAAPSSQAPLASGDDRAAKVDYLVQVVDAQ